MNHRFFSRFLSEWYTTDMTPKLTNDLRDAVQQNGGAIEAEDDQHRLYVVMTRQEFERVVYDDSDLTADEMLAAASQLLATDETADPSYQHGDADSPES